MACPFTKTEEGFEMQLGTNHIGTLYSLYYIFLFII